MMRLLRLDDAVPPDVTVIRIKRSALHRDLSSNWHYAGK